MTDDATCPECGWALPRPSVMILCGGPAGGGRLLIPGGPCRTPACRAAREEAAIADAIARGVISP